MSERSLAPPRFAVAAPAFLYDTDLPDFLYRTYARITGLAWQKGKGTGTRYTETPPLTVYELAKICGVSERSMWRQLAELVRRGLVAYHTEGAVPKRMVLYPVWPRGEATGGRPADAGAHEQACAALAEFGVDVRKPVARSVAALPHVTPELVRAWGRHLQQAPGIRNVPGLLLHLLERNQAPPAAPTGGRDTEQAVPAREEAEARARVHDLPAALRQALEEIGWSGDDAWAEVARMVGNGAADGRGLDFVWAWVRYVQARPHLRPAYLRAQLRGTTWPPQKKDLEERRRAARRARWAEEAAHMPGAGLPGANTPARRAPSREAEAMAEYGIAAETMELWTTTLAALALQMTRETFDTQLRGSLLLSVEEGRATLGVRHARSVEWVQHRLAPTIVRTLSRSLGEEVVALDVVALGDTKSGGHYTRPSTPVQD